MVNDSHMQDIAATTANEFLAFTLGKEEYGIDILKVQEIRGYENVTRIANAPEFIKGVINLRGIIVPIMDMRIKFNLVPCRARLRLQAQTVPQAGSMLPEFPATPPI